MPFNHRELQNKLEHGLMTSDVLLAQSNLLNETARRTAQFVDRHHFPFYYYLGLLSRPESVILVGFQLGLEMVCLLCEDKRLERLLAFQPKDDNFYSPRIGKSNVRQVTQTPLEVIEGDREDFENRVKQHKWGMGIIAVPLEYQTHRQILDLLWEHLVDGGLLTVNYIDTDKASARSFADFAKTKNRQPVCYKTRYGMAILER